jgi:hypothetical protein
MILNELDDQGSFSDTSFADDHQLLLGHEAGNATLKEKEKGEAAKRKECNQTHFIYVRKVR